MKLAKILNLLGIKLNIYRVGDIILTTNSTNPKYDYGGTWELWGAGRVPVGVDTSQNEFSQIEKTGGEKTHTLTVNEMPSHSHDQVYVKSSSTPLDLAGVSGYNSMNSGIGTNTNSVETTGGDQAHNNLQPYITCYMWKKIA